MRYAVIAARILLGLAFIVPGANKLLHFLPIPISPGDATEYLDLLFAHRILTVVSWLEIIGGCLLLMGRYVPLALTILGPIAVNILFFHLFLDTPRIGNAILVVMLEGFLLWAYRGSFRALFEAKAHPTAGRTGLSTR